MRHLLSPVFALLLVAPVFARSELTPVATGDWSQWQDGLRARLVLYKGRATLAPELRESLVYVEIESDMTESAKVVSFYFDPGQLDSELQDAKGKAVNQLPLINSELDGYAKRRPARTLVSLPDAALIRLRVSPYCACRSLTEGLLIPFQDKAWMIKAGDKADYFLTGTLTIGPAKGRDDDSVDSWRGKIELPKLKLKWEAPKEE